MVDTGAVFLRILGFCDVIVVSQFQRPYLYFQLHLQNNS